MNGILIVNKQKGYTSHDLVNKVKRICKEKVGHTGTLDPMATGVIPLLIGEATKLSKYLIEHDKEYEVVLQLGIKTDTADIEGTVIERKQVTDEVLQKETIEDALQSFLGKQKQLPPMYSAIKVNGKKLYEYARSGKKVEVKPREIEIFDIDLISISKDMKEIVYKVWCSKGTYIRSLCEDIAERIGTVGFMSGLNRTRVGDFRIEQAVRISDVAGDEGVVNRDIIKNHFISIESFFEEYKFCDLWQMAKVTEFKGNSIFVRVEL